MRFALFVLTAGLAGCFGTLDASNTGADDKNPGSGSGSGAASECFQDSECVAVGAKCCDCPTFAVPTSDPAYRACTGVTCPGTGSGSGSGGATCPDNVIPRCDGGHCVLACEPLACQLSCPDGFASDMNGCLSCTCAEPVAGGCKLDGDCVETRADCCGCMKGGTDTAVLKQDQAAYDMMLACPAQPQCPGSNTCEPGAAPHCVQSKCELTTGLPPNACGRFDLPMCQQGEECVVNGPDMNANQQGVGVCMPLGM